METDATFTTVLFIDQLAIKKKQTLEDYAEKHLKKMKKKGEHKRVGSGKENLENNRTRISTSDKNTMRTMRTVKNS